MLVAMRIGLLQLNATIGAYDDNRARLEDAYARGGRAGRGARRRTGTFPLRLSSARSAAARRLRPARPRLPRRRSRKRSATCRSSSATSSAARTGPAGRFPTPPPSSTTARSSIASANRFCPPTTSSTRTAISSRRWMSRRSRSPAARSPSPSARTSGTTPISGPSSVTAATRCTSSSQAGAELIINLSASPWERGKEARRAGHAAARGARRKGAARAGQHGRRQRRADLRRPQRGAQRAGRTHRAGRELCGGLARRRCRSRVACHSRRRPRCPRTRRSSFSARSCSACAITCASAASSRS